MKVDLHTHILPRDWPNLKQRYGYGGFIQLCHCQDGTTDMMKDETFFRKVDPNCFSAEDRLKDMEKTGVDVQVLSTVPVMFNYWAKPEDTLDLCQILNDDLAKVVSTNPKKFIGLATLPMQAPELAVKELKRCVKVAEELNACIFIHPWDMKMDGRMEKYWLPWLVDMPSETTTAICSIIFGGVLEKFPKLKICFAHGGGSFPYTIGRITHGHDVRPDLCAVNNKNSPRKYIGQIYTDSLVHDVNALELLVKVIGENNVILGSDYPFPLGEHHPGQLIANMKSFDEQLKDKLLAGNVFNFLGLDRKNYEP